MAGETILYAYLRANPIECLAAGAGILGGFFVSSINPNIRLIGFVVWACGNGLWIVFAKQNKKWAFFLMQLIYLAQNIFSMANTQAGVF